MLALLTTPLTATVNAAAEQTAEQTVEVSISGVEDPLLNNIKGFLPLYGFDGEAAPSVSRLHYLHSKSEEKIREALTPYGYYRPLISTSLELDGDTWQAGYEVEPGDPIPLAELDIRLTGEAENDPAFIQALEESPLKVGKPLLHEDYEALKRTFQVLASGRGYFDAAMKESELRINLQDYEAAVVLHFDSGQRYFLGDVSFNQNKPWLSEDMLARYSDIEAGQPYLAEDLQQLQSDLSNTEYYSEVTLDASPDSADAGRIIPVGVNLTARNPTRYTFGAGYGTDTGARIKGGITGRRVNDSGHHYTVEALLAELKYGIAGEYVIPGADPRTDAWGLRGSLEDEHSDNQDYRAASIGGYFRHSDGLWMKTYSLDYRVERYEQTDGDETSSLLIPGIEWTRTFPGDMDERIYPTYGTMVRLSLRGASEEILSDTSFVQPQIDAKWIYSFANRTRLIARGSAGTTSVSDFDQLPTSLRFFTGGDTSVRGYEYSVIGPTDDDGDVVGGKHLLEAGLEYEVPFAEKWSVAAFYDAGDAFNDSPDYKTGAGLGLHWLSPIGPIRFDLGHAFDDPPGNKLRLHLTIGADL
ncbi:autotransporter assembly complex family protein [Granulosicoccaceae sp. 1_MG-2023]|nr:autotransporter assembly complex family protein [Granulosicoccaceae sp. 1_MG-2023]